MEIKAIASALSSFIPEGTLSEAQLSQVSTYLDLLLKWNAKINLTSVRSPDEILTRHFGESCFLAHQLRNHQVTKSPNQQVIDLGSGAGFPGLPLKIYAPNLCVTLIESNQKKATFLGEVIRALKLTGINVFASRAEDYVALLKNEQISESANEQIIITLRAVEHFDRILPLAGRLLTESPNYEITKSPNLLALLIGSSQLPVARRLLPRFSWNAPIPVPLSRSRILLFGHPPQEPRNEEREPAS
jgi:16S rRNA (guanine527-N7)-methyltransferase